MTASPAKLIFLPGASGNTQFWHPVAERLAHPAQQVHIGWPGFGDTPPVPDVTGMSDLVARVQAEIDRPTALVAASTLPNCCPALNCTFSLAPITAWALHTQMRQRG
ncbi:alpha/beta fold hydrolase [Pseudomonas sp. ABY48]|uniref:alpha/beta fold hydrolase n=1 Tax=Pseudomonas sp. ABY48 TaxID=3402865 RepID=UPI003B4362CC